MIPTRTKPIGCGRSSSAASKPNQRGRFADVPVLHFVWLTRRHAQGKSATKASKLEPSSTKLAAVSVRNPSETKS